MISSKEFRKETQMSQKEFSEYYNIPLRTLQDWEQGRRNPSEYILEMMKRIWYLERDKKEQYNNAYKLKKGTKLTFLSGKDKGNVFILLSDLLPCARTEGCYRAKYEDETCECYIYVETLQELGYIVLK